MKNIITILTLITIVNLYSCIKAQTIPVTTKLLGSNGMIYKMNQHVILSYSLDYRFFEQIDSKSNRIINSFTYNDAFEKKCYSNFFDDNNYTYNYTKSVYMQEGLSSPLIEIYDIFTDKNNLVYVFYKGNNVIINPNSTETDKRAIISFYGIVQIKDNNINKYWNIPQQIFNDTFEIGLKTCLRTDNGFLLPLHSIKTKKEDCRFLIQFTENPSSPQLTNFSILPIGLPQYHLSKGYKYDLLDFMGNDSLIMLATSNSLLDIKSGKETILHVDELGDWMNKNPSSKPNLQKGQFLNFDYSSADFYITNENIRLLYRYKNNFYLNTYSRDGSELISKQKISYTFNQLQRFPFFDDKGHVIIQPKRVMGYSIYNFEE